VFEAVRLGILPLIKRRLTSEERDYLTSGNVFVWEEAEHKGGLERWTDGRRWSVDISCFDILHDYPPEPVSFALPTGPKVG